ncbi:MAG: 2-oxoglutarate dehydrogenase complex dihydrolipoyllysine-residue succinyltransferase [Anaerolineales bacterium]|nr:2-oxoglutarate dehydrogenase complex dihydrolipoyllysine-residue succinyltransferase [Anaerolineales bacterium]
MTVKIVVPEAGESVVEATVARWLKQEGDYVEAGEALVELETDKVNLEVAAEQSGVLTKIEHGQGEDVEVGDVLGLIDETASPDGAAPKTEGQPSQAKADPQPRDAQPAEAQPERATPIAKRVAEEQGVDLAQVADGSKRITRQDVESYLEKKQSRPAPAAAPAPAADKPARQPDRSPQPEPEPARDSSRPETRERMTRRRQTIAQRLVEAQQTAAMLTTFNEIDMSAVMDLRKRRQAAFVDRHDIKLGFMSFFVKASIGALKAFPAINAEISGKDIIYKHYYDIGMAVGAPEGLVVPVLRDADRMSFADIEQKIKAFGQKAQSNTLSLDDLRGGTFTITNGGIFGSLLSTPILNPPQVGILGLHKIEERPIAIGGEVVIRPMMYVALSYDHRIVDGREAVQFLVRVKELMEDPEVMLLEG